MSDEMSCGQVRELAAELALGIADGQERDAALRHVATCPDCRAEVGDLSRVVDDLIVLAPEHEPPPGFAARTVDRLGVRAPRRIRWRSALTLAASIVLAIALGAGVMFRATSDDRRLADSYRSVLGQGHGSFF